MKFTLASIYLTLVFLAFRVEAQNTCRQFFAPTPAQQGYGELRALIQNSFKDFDSEPLYWANAPTSSPVQIVEWATHIKPDEKKELLELLSSQNESMAKTFTKLALHDKETWRKHIVDVVSLKEKWTDNLAPVIRAMPENFRLEIMSLISTLYPIAKKEMFNGLPPKRALDAMIHACIPAEQIFRKLTSKGRSSMQVYQYYLDLVSKALPQNGEFGGYKAIEIYEAAKVVQDRLAQNALQDKDAEVIWFGSFPNGRARLNSSDIDTKIKNSAAFRGDFSQLDAEINSQLNSKLNANSPRANLKIEFLNTDDLAGNKIAKYNPVVIRISANKIELQVYPLYTIRNPTKDNQERTVIGNPFVFELRP